MPRTLNLGILLVHSCQSSSKPLNTALVTHSARKTGVMRPPAIWEPIGFCSVSADKLPPLSEEQRLLAGL